MSNYISGKVWNCDTVGFLSKTPVNILGIQWVPNGSADAVILSYYPGDVQVAAKGVGATITGNNTITRTSAANDFPNTYRASDALWIRQSTGSRANLGMHLITTAGNNTVVVTEAELANEALMQYDLLTLTARIAFKTHPAATDSQFIHFDGFKIPNLALTTIPSSGLVLIYIA